MSYEHVEEMWLRRLLNKETVDVEKDWNLMDYAITYTAKCYILDMVGDDSLPDWTIRDRGLKAFDVLTAWDNGDFDLAHQRLKKYWG